MTDTDTTPATAPKPGDLVISKWDAEPFIYGGPSDQPGMTKLKIGRLSDGRYGVERFCDPEDVAPAGTPIPDKDDRARIVKLPKKRYPWDSGPWMAYLPGVPEEQATAHATKRAAHAQAMRRLAIADHVAARRALTWESAGTGEPGDQNAESAIVPAGATSAHYSIGPEADGRWSLRYTATDHGDPIESLTEYFGRFGTEDAAKDAAQEHESAEAR
jgi:hypothetical protein